MSSEYHPFLDTLRLYAGWLLACLTAVYAYGGYQNLRHLPVHVSIVDEWITSPMIHQVTFLTFVFLLLSSIHRLAGGGVWKGMALAVIGLVLLLAFATNA